MFRKIATPTTPSASPSAGVVTDTAPCEKSLRLTVRPETIAPIRSAVLAEFQRQAALPGFRKGKAPTALVERQYAQQIQEETLQRTTRQAVEAAAKAHALKPVGPFEIKTSTFSDANGLTLEATVEVEPDFTLEAYKGIPLTREPVTVTPEELAKALASLQESMAQLVPAKEGPAKERQVPALDDELAKDLGLEHLAALRAHVEAKLREQKLAAQSRALERSLCEALLARHPFQVPARLVGHQTERLTRDFKTRLLLSGMPEEQVDAEAAKFVEQLRTSATHHVKLSFILDRIATQEAIGVTQDELVKRLWQLSQQWKKDPAEVRKIFDARGLWSSIASAIREEHTMAFLMASAAIANGSITKGG